MRNLIGFLLITFVFQSYGSQIIHDSTLVETNYIEGLFKIMSISKKKDVYIIYASKDGINYKIASPKSYRPHGAKRILIDNSYYMILESYMLGISPFYRVGINAIEVSPKNNIYTDKETYQLYKALNLKGLYYISRDQVSIDSIKRRIPDHVKGIFKISRINRQKNVYIILATKDNVIYKIVSPISFKMVDVQKIKKNMSYYFVLFSLKDDLNSDINSFEVAPKNFIKTDKNTRNLYETSYLSGLYYLSNE